MKCPRDSHELVPRANGEQRLLHCPECEGLWVPGEAVDALLGAGEKLKLRSLCSVTVSELRCPADGDQLGEGRIGGVTVDFCLKCNGLWLDKGELEALRKRKPIAPYKAPEKETAPAFLADTDEALIVSLLLISGM